MEIISPTSDFDFNSISLADPQPLNGHSGFYFTQLSVGDENKSLCLQLPECYSKQGIVNIKNGKYLDLMFERINHNELMSWVEKLEYKCQDIIDEKKDLWFQTELTRDDIETMMTQITRFYQSGKYILMRVFIDVNKGGNKCIAYDEREIGFDLDTLEPNQAIIPLVILDGVKFSSRSFEISLKLTQVMVVDVNDKKSSCLIKRNYKKKIEPTNTTDNLGQMKKDTMKGGGEPASLEPASLEPASLEPASLEPALIEPALIEPASIEPSSLEPASLEPASLEPASLEPASLEPAAIDNDDNEINIKINSEVNDVETNETKSNTKDISNNKNDIQYSENIKINIQKPKPKPVIKKETSFKKDINDNSKLSLDLHPIELTPQKNDIEEINIDYNKINNDTISLKNPNEVYYIMYQTAREKAKQCRTKAIEAYLEAKQIKTKYMLFDIDDDSDDSDIFEEEDN